MDTGGTRDLVIDGDTGFVVRPQKVEDWLRVWRSCVVMPIRRKMGEAGRCRVVQRFTTQHMAHQYEDLCKALLSCVVHPKDHG